MPHNIILTLKYTFVVSRGVLMWVGRGDPAILWRNGDRLSTYDPFVSDKAHEI
jgi:hypothetical protein